MAIQTTRWTPDTCNGCVIDYQWDDSVDSSVRVHTPVTIIAKCADHASVANPTTHHTKLTKENTTKNRVLDYLDANFPTLVIDDGNGNTHIDPSKVSWSFDAARTNLTIVIPSLTAAQLVAVNTQAAKVAAVNVTVVNVKP